MSVSEEFTRDQWAHIGGLQNVAPMIDVVILRFGEDYDEREDEDPERTETIIDDENAYITWSQTLPYQRFDRQESGVWYLTDTGEQTFTDSMIIGKREPS